MVTFNLDGGKMYGFDVKATDCEGSENGNSATTTVFVSKKNLGFFSLTFLTTKYFCPYRFMFYLKPK